MWPWSKPPKDPEIAELRAQVAALDRVLHSLEAKIERGSTVAVRADLDALTGRVESFATSTSKQLGKLWQRERAPLERGDDGRIESAESTGDGDLDELLRIQAEWGSAKGDRH